MAQGCGHQQAGLGPPTPGGPQLFSPTTARALLKDPAIPVEEVTTRLQVSPATLYRHFPGGRSGLAEATGGAGDARRPPGRPWWPHVRDRQTLGKGCLRGRSVVASSRAAVGVVVSGIQCRQGGSTMPPSTEVMAGMGTKHRHLTPDLHARSHHPPCCLCGMRRPAWCGPEETPVRRRSHHLS